MPGERELDLRGEILIGVACGPSPGITNTVSERFSSRAIRCMTSVSRPDPSRNTATGLPCRGTSVNTSAITYWRSLMACRPS